MYSAPYIINNSKIWNTYIWLLALGCLLLMFNLMKNAKWWLIAEKKYLNGRYYELKVQGSGKGIGCKNE